MLHRMNDETADNSSNDSRDLDETPVPSSGDIFEDWYNRLTATAKTLKCEYLVGDAESHRAAFEDGVTPLDEILDQIDAIS